MDKVQYIMAEMKIRNLPVLKDGAIHGILTLGDVSDHYFRYRQRGGEGSVLGCCEINTGNAAVG